MTINEHEELYDEEDEFDESVDENKILPYMNEKDRNIVLIRQMVRGAYDIQKLRIQTGNRIVINFKAKLGQAPSQKEKDIGKKEKKVIDEIRSRYKRFTDGVVGNIPRVKSFVGDEVISTYTELCLVDQYFDLESKEKKHFLQLEKILQPIPIYSEFLSKVRGCGPAMSGVIISEIDIHKARYVSSIWAYCGLDVGHDGKGRSMRKEHLVLRDYVSKSGEKKEKLSITFNPFIKSKLVGVMAKNFIKLKSPFAEHYYNYRHRLDCHQDHKKKPAIHKFKMSCRYMIKMFCIPLYKEWKTIEGLPCRESYMEAKLNMEHNGKEIRI